MNTSETINTAVESKSSPVNDEVLQKAYQLVAQSSAIAIQDATDNLRNMNTISTAAIGVAMAQMLETPGTEDQMQKVIAILQTLSADAAANFQLTAQHAIYILNNFPKGQ